jgi:hypothetical protein
MKVPSLKCNTVSGMLKPKPVCKTDQYGDSYWYINGKLHREDGPAMITSDGIKRWFLKGEYHREDGPAIEYPNGDKSWYLNGKYHREDGPALEFSDGVNSWYKNGQPYTPSAHEVIIYKMKYEKKN